MNSPYASVTTDAVTVPATTVAVIREPLTRAQAESLVDDDGNLSVTVSLDWSAFVHAGDKHDEVQDLMAESVLADLSGCWTLQDYMAVGPDPRDRDRVLLTIGIAPNYDEPQDSDA